MEFKWWQTGVVYQIYPRSFKDGNGDGIGDLLGIIEKLDHLVALGVDAIWISPIYPSPMADFGYDVANYTDIHPMFGDLATFDRLLEAAHSRGLRVILDWVPNHTSDQHPWFLESQSSRDNARADWYIWRDPAPDGGPPNNWGSIFGGPSWTWNETRQQYYLHLFLRQQPDLNWRNPDVRAAMHNVLRFWLDRGVDGFRMDVIDRIVKDADLRDNPWLPDGDPTSDNLFAQQEHAYDLYQPDIIDEIRQIRAVFDSYDGDRVTIGEVWAEPRSRWVTFYGPDLDGLHLPFNFFLLVQPWDAQAMRASVDELEAALPAGAWPNYVLGNHDRPRLATRYGPEVVRTAAMLLLTLRGTPTLYMGDELGMADGHVPPDRMQDPPGLRLGPEYSRDGCRTPFQWSGAPFAGFSTVEPWLPVAASYPTLNAATEEDDPASVLALYRRLLSYRRATPALHGGSYSPVDGMPADCYVYVRANGSQRRLIALNFGGEARTLDLGTVAGQGRVIISTALDRDETVDLGQISLRPHEGVIIELPE